jgi:AAA domain
MNGDFIDTDGLVDEEHLGDPSEANGGGQGDSQPQPGPQPGSQPPTGLGEWNAAEDVDPPPPRGWLLGNTFCRTFLSSLIGAGGVGKTALRYAQALSLATGRKLTDEHVFQRCRVLIVSLEDDDKELRRRIRAARLHYNIPLSELDGWLWLAAPGAKGGKLMQMDKKGRVAVAGKLGANIEAAIVAHSIDLVMLDPFVKSHSVEENLNSAIDDVAQILTDLATKHNIAVDAPHHVRKGQMVPGDAEAGRGASSLNAAARLVYTCLPMNEEDAATFGISQEDRREYIRVDSGKINIAKASRNAQWFHLVSVALDNATAAYPSGDEVQTVEPWEPPKTWVGVNNDDIDSILNTIDAGLSDGNLYSDAPSATKRAAWKVIQSVMSAKPEAQCREMIRTWVNNGILVKTPYKNPKNRNDETGLKLSPQKREELDKRDVTRRRTERRKTLEPLAAVVAAWKAAIGVDVRRTLAHVIEMAAVAINPDLNAAFLAVAAMDDGKTISNVLLARWLVDFNEVPVDGFMLSGGGVDDAGSPWWTLVSANQREPD